MEQCPLDEEIAVETFESIQAKLEEVQEVLSKRYGLPKVQAQFRNALQRKLAAEEIYDEPDVQLWQSLFGAVLARAKLGSFVAPPKAPDEYRAQEYRRYQGYINDLF